MKKIIIILFLFNFTIFPKDSTIKYLGEEFSENEYKELKTEELNKFKKDIKNLSCSIKFEYHNSKYFSIAYHSKKKQMLEILNYMEIFYKNIYPKFFDTDPNFSFRIVIFKSQEEFQKCTKSPEGLYGFYYPYSNSPQSNTFYTFSDSGYGTYWHEIMHGFIDANTDIKPPDWFNEGLASFYEKTPYMNGKINEGYTNWRHPILKNSIKEKSFIPLKELISKYKDRSEIALSESRFLFLYIWKKKSIEVFAKKYLEEILPNYKDDVLTVKTIELLEMVTGLSIEKIEQEMQSLILELDSDMRID